MAKHSYENSSEEAGEDLLRVPDQFVAEFRVDLRGAKCPPPTARSWASRMSRARRRPAANLMPPASAALLVVVVEAAPGSYVASQVTFADSPPPVAEHPELLHSTLQSGYPEQEAQQQPDSQ
jgi:hypothetical protein